MSSSSDCAKQGYVKVKSKKIGKWNKRWVKLYAARGSSSAAQLVKYQDEAASRSPSAHRAVYELSDVENISRLTDPSRHGVYIVLSDLTTVQFAADSDADAEAWKKAIEQAISGDHRYEVFQVYVMKTAHMQNSGDSLLQVTPDTVRLLDIDDPSRVQLEWPLSGIRRYSIERGIFTLEAGRSCPTGEGLFMFESRDHDTIYERVQEAARRLAASKRQMKGPRSPRFEPKIAGAWKSDDRHFTGDSGTVASGTKFNNTASQTRSQGNSPLKTINNDLANSGSSSHQSSQTRSNDYGQYDRAGNQSPSSYSYSTPCRRADADAARKVSTGTVGTETSPDYDLAGSFYSSQAHSNSRRRSGASQHSQTTSPTSKQANTLNQPGQSQSSQTAWQTSPDYDMAGEFQDEGYDVPTRPPASDLRGRGCETGENFRTTGNGGIRRQANGSRRAAELTIDNQEYSQPIRKKKTATVSTAAGCDDDDVFDDGDPSSRPGKPVKRSNTREAATSTGCGTDSSNSYSQKETKSCGTSAACDDVNMRRADTVNRGTSTGASHESIVPDEHDEELSNVLQEAFQKIGLRVDSYFVDRIELPE